MSCFQVYLIFIYIYAEENPRRIQEVGFSVDPILAFLYSYSRASRKKMRNLDDYCLPYVLEKFIISLLDIVTKHRVKRIAY